jgi:hypothetical protein
MIPRRSTSWFLLVLLTFGFLVLLWMPTELYARAGGGGGGGGGSGGGRGGLIKLVILVFYLIYAGLVWLVVQRREQQARGLMDKLAAMESSWGREAVRRRIHNIYFKVQEAWARRDQKPARDFMSDRLFELHQSLCDEMRTKGEKNILQEVALNKIQIVEVADFLDDTQDRMWVIVHGSMIDYIVDERSDEVLRGDKNKKEDFKELWKFVRGPKGWVLDEIDQSVDLDELLGFKSSAEAPKTR